MEQPQADFNGIETESSEHETTIPAVVIGDQSDENDEDQSNENEEEPSPPRTVKGDETENEQEQEPPSEAVEIEQVVTHRTSTNALSVITDTISRETVLLAISKFTETIHMSARFVLTGLKAPPMSHYIGVVSFALNYSISPLPAWGSIVGRWSEGKFDMFDWSSIKEQVLGTNCYVKEIGKADPVWVVYLTLLNADDDQGAEILFLGCYILAV